MDSCHDGDTCRVEVGGLAVNVRLAGVDAPEVARAGRPEDQPYGVEAKRFVAERVVGHRVALRTIDLDPYNRPVVEMRVDAAAIPVNLALIAAGLAEVYRRAPPPLDLAPYVAAEAEARAARRGIWSLDRYTPPSAFRAAQKAPNVLGPRVRARKR